MRPLVLVGGILGVAALALPAPAGARAEVCVTPDNYESMLKTNKHVLVGRMEPIGGEPYPTAFVVKPIRVWKGGKKEISLAAGPCSMTPRANRLYVVFANEEREMLTACAPVFGLWEDRGKVAVTRLDRARRFPPLSVDAEDLKP